MRERITMSKWSRPDSVPFPTTWDRFEGKITINGKKRSYWIQDVTDEYKAEIVNYMVNGFIADEPTCKYSKSYQLEEMVEVRNIWMKCLECKLGLVCLTEDENGKPTIAAMNCTTLETIPDEADEVEKPNRIMKISSYVKQQADPFKKLNITKYLDALGLYVVPKYRGEGLGLALLKAREPLCKACGITTSVTLFSSVVSQKLAVRAGFKDLYIIDYEELGKINPIYNLAGIQEHTKTLRYMYIIYE